MGRWDNVFGIWIALVLAFALVVTIAYHFARKAWRSRSRRDPWASDRSCAGGGVCCTT